MRSIIASDAYYKSMLAPVVRGMDMVVEVTIPGEEMPRLYQGASVVSVKHTEDFDPLSRWDAVSSWEVSLLDFVEQGRGFYDETWRGEADNHLNLDSGTVATFFFKKDTGVITTRPTYVIDLLGKSVSSLAGTTVGDLMSKAQHTVEGIKIGEGRLASLPRYDQRSRAATLRFESEIYFLTQPYWQYVYIEKDTATATTYYDVFMSVIASSGMDKNRIVISETLKEYNADYLYIPPDMQLKDVLRFLSSATGHWMFTDRDNIIHITPPLSPGRGYLFDPSVYAEYPEPQETVPIRYAEEAYAKWTVDAGENSIPQPTLPIDSGLYGHILKASDYEGGASSYIDLRFSGNFYTAQTQKDNLDNFHAYYSGENTGNAMAPMTTQQIVEWLRPQFFSAGITIEPDWVKIATDTDPINVSIGVQFFSFPLVSEEGAPARASNVDAIGVPVKTGEIVQMENKLIPSRDLARGAAAQLISMIGLHMPTYEMKHAGEPTLEVGDTVQVQIADESPTDAVILHNEWVYDGMPRDGFLIYKGGRS